MVEFDAELKERLKTLGEQVKKTAKEIAVKEVAKFHDEVIKVIMCESGFTQELLSGLITQKEVEIFALSQTREAAETEYAELEEQRKTQSDYRRVCRLRSAVRHVKPRGQTDDCAERHRPHNGLPRQHRHALQGQIASI
jgi:hypothetical protein